MQQMVNCIEVPAKAGMGKRTERTDGDRCNLEQNTNAHVQQSEEWRY